ncbi:MAG: class I SAM-dependent methyltransferase [bacterium]
MDRKKLPAIKQAVHNAERDYVYQKSGFNPSLDNRVFGTAGPRDAIYWAMPVDHFVTYVDELGLGTGQSLGILGTGFGLDAFYAATRFMRVTGFEIDLDIYNAAEEIRASFDVRNITFRNQDFLEADLCTFNVVSFFFAFLP